MESCLKLSVGGLPPWSARGCHQTLFPVSKSTCVRTVNGELIQLPQNHPLKYRTLIECEDVRPVAINHVALGEEMKVWCLQTLIQRTTHPTTLQRDPVEGSIDLISTDKKAKVEKVEGRKVFLNPSTQEAYIQYRPKLNMRLIDFRMKTNEWGEKTGWQMTLDEI